MKLVRSPVNHCVYPIFEGILVDRGTCDTNLFCRYPKGEGEGNYGMISSYY